MPDCLVERQSFVLHTVRDVHETITDCTARSWSVGLLIAAAIVIVVITAARSIALTVSAVAELNIICDDICGINSLSLFVGVASRLNPALQQDSSSLSKILLHELCGLAEGSTADKIGSLLISIVLISAASAVYRNRKSGNRHRILALCISDLGISGKSAHEDYSIHTITLPF